MMNRNSHIWALSAATTVGILYCVFSLLLFFAPEPFMNLIMRGHYIVPGTMPIAFRFNMMDGLLGLVLHFVVTYAIVVLFMEVQCFIEERA